MPAKIPAPVRTRIRQMREAGERLQTIADKIGLNRKTVAKYCEGGEKKPVPAPPVPAAQFTADEVSMLQWLAAVARRMRCPSCEGEVTYLASSPGVVCPRCRRPLM